jgi:hypothetical protein
MRKNLVLLFAALALVLSAIAVRPAQHVFAGEPKILEFNTMVGVPLAYTGTKSPIRGVNGGGLPWVINGANGELKASGKLELRITGLVFDPNDPSVPADRKGRNTVTSFRALVSCQTVVDGAATVVNVLTEPFPATVGLATEGGGNAKVETTLNLPRPCIAPIVFVTSPTGSWFAATGN